MVVVLGMGRVARGLSRSVSSEMCRAGVVLAVSCNMSLLQRRIIMQL